MQNYLDLVDRVLRSDYVAETRNGGRRTVFVHNLQYDLGSDFPLLTTRKIPWKNVIHELIWFLNGETNTKYLNDNGVRIWNANADEHGECGPIYGYQWRNFNSQNIDQIVHSIKLLRSRKHSTRNVVMAWNPAQQWAMKLPPCHVMFQLFSDGKYLSLCAQMRSTDVILGLPTNIASYALLTHFYCKLLDLRPGELFMSLGDTHIYAEHIEQAPQLLERSSPELPTVTINRVTPDLRNLLASDVTLQNYTPQPSLSFHLVA